MISLEVYAIQETFCYEHPKAVGSTSPNAYNENKIT